MKVGVGVPTGVAVAVDVADETWSVRDAAWPGVGLEFAVAVGMGVWVEVGVAVSGGVGEGVDVGVKVLVAVGVAVPSVETATDRCCPMMATRPTTSARPTATLKTRRFSVSEPRGKSLM